MTNNELEKQQNRLQKEQQAILELKRKEEAEIENIMMKKAMTFEDIEKLNYKQINMVSNKYGEDEFNPNDILDMNDDVSESDQDEILRKYKAPSQHPSMHHPSMHHPAI